MTPLPDPAQGLEVDVRFVESLAAAIAAGEVQLVDCREEDEWRFNHLPGARWVPLSSFETGAAGLVDDGRPVVVYCHHGMRSMRATTWLRSRGLDQAWSMAGGIHEWSRQVDPEVPTY